MNQEIVYVAELDQDVDDVIAARYLHMQHALKEAYGVRVPLCLYQCT